MNLTPKICVILSTFNSSKFIFDQIKSLEGQTGVRIECFVIDDFSDISEFNYLKKTLEKSSLEFKLVRNLKNVGPATNFIKALRNVWKNYDFFAFCDQDDVWEPFKLSRAVKCLGELKAGLPTLYCSRTTLVDSNLKFIGLSPLMRIKPSFGNALVQSIAGGNTMVFNQKAAKYISSSIDRTESLLAHDWWTYIIVTGVGGIVVYDSTPTLKYRQHAGNVVGSNMGVFARLKRLQILLSGRYKKWMDFHIGMLMRNQSMLTTENQRILNDFIQLRVSRNRFAMMVKLRKLGLVRQTKLGTAALFLGSLFSKV